MIARQKKIEIRKHDCRKNWCGSSKGMEPFLTVRCLQKLKQHGLNVKKITMDDDSSTYVRAIRTLFPDLKKSGDKNHVLKNMANGLFKIKQNHKSLTVGVINYLRKCFSYAISRNQGNPINLKRNISAIIPHAFGDHKICNTDWCRAQNEEYVHSSLPNGKDLQGLSMRTDLEKEFMKYTTDAMTEKLSNLQSTNINENINNMISRKAPKTLYYSESESLDFRVAAAVSQKNEGHGYIVTVNEVHGLSPGKFTSKRCNSLDKKRNSAAEMHKSLKQKKRHLQLKEERYVCESTSEVREGKTYEACIDAADDITATDIDVIPPPPVCTQSTGSSSATKDSVVVFDLETTGLGMDSCIMQIAARMFSNNQTYTTYVKPDCNFIPRKVTCLTGIEMHNKTMYYNLTRQIQSQRLKDLPNGSPRFSLLYC